MCLTTADFADNSDGDTATTKSTSSQHQEDGAKNRQEMYERFQSWASQNYGETGKTKTVTSRKYNRIIRILTGEEPASSENSKFRFWVKAKGFRLGPPPADEPNVAEQVLYVPTKTAVSHCVRGRLPSLPKK